MYVAVKGGEKAIDNAHEILEEDRRGDLELPEIGVGQISEQLGRAVDRVMTEGSVYDPELAALAVKQAQGDLVEAIFLLRAFRATLPRLAVSRTLNTGEMRIRRRISATFKDLPGGQILGPTYDYTHRLLDFGLMTEKAANEPSGETDPSDAGDQKSRDAEDPIPKVLDLLDRDGLIETFEASTGDEAGEEEVGDLTREPLTFPAGRDLRLQNLARGDEGFLLALGYSTQRGFGNNHPFAGEIRLGEVDVEIVPEELDFPVPLGEITVTECEMITQFKGSKEQPPKFTRGYGLAFGHCERKAMAMALVDRALRTKELGEEPKAPAQDEEFVLYHSDNVESSGFVEHLKLPHYVDFQAELTLIRKLRQEHDDPGSGSEPAAERAEAGE